METTDASSNMDDSIDGETIDLFAIMNSAVVELQMELELLDNKDYQNDNSNGNETGKNNTGGTEHRHEALRSPSTSTSTLPRMTGNGRISHPSESKHQPLQHTNKIPLNRGGKEDSDNSEQSAVDPNAIETARLGDEDQCSEDQQQQQQQQQQQATTVPSTRSAVPDPSELLIPTNCTMPNRGRNEFQESKPPCWNVVEPSRLGDDDYAPVADYSIGPAVALRPARLGDDDYVPVSDFTKGRDPPFFAIEPAKIGDEDYSPVSDYTPSNANKSITAATTTTMKTMKTEPERQMETEPETEPIPLAKTIRL